MSICLFPLHYVAGIVCVCVTGYLPHRLLLAATQILIFSFCNLECFKCVYQNFKNRGAMLKIKPTLRLYFSQSFSMPFFLKCMKDSFHLFIIMTSLIATMHTYATMHWHWIVCNHTQPRQAQAISVCTSSPSPSNCLQGKWPWHFIFTNQLALDK